VEIKALRFVTLPESLDGILGHTARRRHLGQRPAVGTPEPQRAVRPARDLVALLVDRSMMKATEQDKIRERGGATLRPVAHMMPLADPHAAARKAAALVPMMQRPS